MTTLVQINRYNRDKQNLKKIIGNVAKKIPDISGLVTATVLDTKIKDVDCKITGLSGLVKKAHYDGKILQIEGKYFTTSDYNKCTSGILDAKIKQKELVNKSDISSLVKNSNLNTKLAITSNKRRIESRAR